MSDEVPDTTEAWYVQQTVTDTASDQRPYSTFYGPYSKDGANDKAAELEGWFANRERSLTNPDGPAPVASTRSQDLQVIDAATFDAAAADALHRSAEPEPEAEPAADAPSKGAASNPSTPATPGA